MFLTAFILFGIIPFIVMRFFFQGTWREYGLHPGEWRAGLPVVLVLFVLISVLFLFPASQTTEIQKYFPYDKSAGDSIFNFLRLQFFRGLLFYSSWEFFFRGFLLFSLRKYVGDWLAVCIQVIPSCLWHLGLPAGEIFSSIVAGILFGCLALRTRSVIWPFLLHYMVGIILDVFIIMTT
jgi:membrane protease YdiL (CAAX protease family)